MVVDEADNLLNTHDGWLARGESQDKGWLNGLLEEPGARVIWITNRVENIDPSVGGASPSASTFGPSACGTTAHLTAVAIASRPKATTSWKR